jgi:hypothetical protein
MVTVTLKCSQLLIVTVNLKCSLFLVFTVTLKFSVLFTVTVTLSLPPFCSGNERSRPRKASRRKGAASSHSRHFNTVLYPRSYSESQLPLNRSHRYIPVAAFSVQNDHNSLTHSSIFTGTSADLSTYA